MRTHFFQFVSLLIISLKALLFCVVLLFVCRRSETTHAFIDTVQNEEEHAKLVGGTERDDDDEMEDVPKTEEEDQTEFFGCATTAPSQAAKAFRERGALGGSGGC